MRGAHTRRRSRGSACLLSSLLVCAGCASSNDNVTGSVEGANGSTPSSTATVSSSCTSAPVSRWLASPPTPKWTANFDSAASLASSEITLETAAGDSNTGEFVAGRGGGLAYRPKGTYLKIPAAKVINPGAGSIALWIGNETFTALSGSAALTIFDTDNWRNASNFQTGWAISLKRAGYTGDNAQTLRTLFTPGDPYALADATEFKIATVDTSVTKWAAGQWHHLVVTWSATTIRTYVDGSLSYANGLPSSELATTLVPKSIPSNVNMYLLSSRRGGAIDKTTGSLRIDTMSSYASELASDHVARLYNEGVSSGPTMRSSTECLAIELTGDSDGYGIRRIYDGSVGSAKTLGSPSRRLWQLKLRSTDGKETYVDNTAALGAKVTFTPGTVDSIIAWKGIPLPTTAGVYGTQAIDVTYTLTAMTGGAIGAKLSASFLPNASWAIAEARVLQLKDLSTMGALPEATSLVFPDRSVGRNLPNPFDGLKPLKIATEALYPSRDMAMQWFGIATNSSSMRGLYVAALDPSASTKAFRLSRKATAAYSPIDAEIAIFAENTDTPGNGFSMNWPVVVALQTGNWYDHARRYRSFAQTAPWMPLSLVKKADVPTWMRNAGLINQGAASSDSTTLAGQLKSAGAPDGLLLWHQTQWDTVNAVTNKQFNDTPFLTPRTDLTTRLSNANTAAVPTALYFDPVAWDVADDTLSTPTPWASNNGESMAVRNLDDSISTTNPKAPYNASFKGAGEHHVYMCPASQQWRNLTLGKLGSLLSNYSFAGFYLDQIGSYAPRLCHSKTHAHPVGGGHHWVDGHRAFLTALRAKFKSNQGIYIEGFTEPYVNVVDGFLTWDAEVENAVPLTQVVYHDYTQFLGRAIEVNNNGGVTGLEASTAKQAELLAWGGMPGYHNTSMTQVPLAPFREYLFTLARARRTFVNYLVDGELLPSTKVTLRSDSASGAKPQLGASVQTTALPTQSIASVDMDGHPGTWTGPVVLHSVWKGAGAKALVLLASSEWSAPTRTIQVELPSSIGLGASAKITATSVSLTGTTVTTLGTTAIPAFVRVEMPQRGVIAIELAY